MMMFARRYPTLRKTWTISIRRMSVAFSFYICIAGATSEIHGESI